MDVQALQGETKAISAESDTVQFLDTDDDCAQLQKSAAILFGFAGKSWASQASTARCADGTHLVKSQPPWYYLHQHLTKHAGA